MSLVCCPECRTPMCESANTCPGCGIAVTSDLIATPKDTEPITSGAIWLVCVCCFFLPILAFSGVIVSRPSSSPSTSAPERVVKARPASSPSATVRAVRRQSTSSSLSAPERPVESSYVTDALRQRELGQKYYPTQNEIREYLILDARQSVREGAISASAFEQWTGEKFSQ